ncbi:MAG: hypothetical protein U0165_13035 [Polyangiaceae bacterium]
MIAKIIGRLMRVIIVTWGDGRSQHARARAVDRDQHDLARSSIEHDEPLREGEA